jgi:TIR domain
MATIWLTYAWTDNTTNDVDYVAQELGAAGLTVKLDRWEIGAGRRLWDQSEKFIQDPSESDAWLIYATPNSLGSEACKEEYAYALDRALHTRGQEFPVVGVFPSSVDQNLIPAGIRTRLYVSLTDPDWKERIIAAAVGRTANIARPSVSPYFVKVYEKPLPGRNYAVEMRPRAGTWSPFIAAIPLAEKETVKPSILRGPSGRPPGGGVLHMTSRGASPGGHFWVESAQDESTPTQSYYFFCEALPSRLIFGVEGRGPQYDIPVGARGVPGTPYLTA